MPNKMLIDASHPEETRVVVVRGNRIEEFDFESQDKKQLKGNIYLARVTRVEPSLQAAFVEYGGNRHGFLAFSEIHPDYYQIPVADRQALLKADAEAASADEDDDSDDEERRGRGRRRRRGRNRDGERRGSEASGESRTARDDDESGDDLAPIEQMTAGDDAGAEGASEVVEAVEQAEAAPNTESPARPTTDEDDDSTPPAMAAAIDSDVVSEPAPKADAPDADEDRGTVEDVSHPSDEESGVESVGAEDALEEVRERRRPMRRSYKIQEVIKRRQILLVQVVKEERGNKGAALTTYLSLAGRYSVLMPNTARGGGISRKITNVQDRKRLKEVVQDLDVPDGMGVILRTAGESRTKAEIKRDYEYLMRLWETVRTLTLQSTAPALVYEEGSLIKRSVRDLYNKDIDEILVAGEDGYREAKDFMRMLMPSHAKVVQPYRDIVPIFARNGIEAQLDKMLQPQVTLKSGGYIIINQTEALVAIDVNSGRSTKEHSIEDTALQTNLEAAEEVARQLRLRDLAGLIVIDFIDMEENRNNRSVEKRLKDHLKNDRARIQVGRISHFGLLEMSRQRIRASVLESTMKPCPHCGGTGHIRSDSSVALLVVRGIEEFLLKDSRCHITVRTPAATALYVLNHKRSTLVDMERQFGVTITIEADDAVGAQHFTVIRGAVAEKPAVLQGLPAPIGYVEAESLDEDMAEVEEAETEAEDEEERADARAPAAADDGNREHRKRRRRRRRGGRDRDREGVPQDAHPQSAQDADKSEQDDENGDEAGEESGEAGRAETADSQDADSQDADRKRRRRGKRGGRRNRPGEENGSEGADEAESVTAGEAEPVEALAESVAESIAAIAPDAESAAEAPAEATSVVSETAEAAPEKPKRPRRSRAKKTEASEAAAEPTEAAAPAEAAEPAAAAPASEPVAEEAVAETAPVSVPEPAEAAEPARASRRRPAAEVPSEPVVVSSAPEADKPKKGGWWQRKGFL
jgi:ribonuclease E